MLPNVTQQPGTNLDRLAARHAQAIIEGTRNQVDKGKIDNTVTKTLAILQESGFYACFLFLLAKRPPGHEQVVEQLVGLLQGLGFARPAALDEQSVLPYVTDTVTAALEPMLLAKETAEQMLTYARYGAKARG